VHEPDDVPLMPDRAAVPGSVRTDDAGGPEAPIGAIGPTGPTPPTGSIGPDGPDGPDKGARVTRTGDALVDGVLTALDGLGDLPVAEHAAVFEAAHLRLHAVLTGAAGTTSTTRSELT
jgi:hypothetical protein